MNTKILYIALAVLALALGAASPGFARQSGDGDILQKAVNKPSANWQVYGAGQRTNPVKDKTVAGGGAMKIEVQAASDKPWASRRPCSYSSAGTWPLARIFQLKGSWSELTSAFSQMLVVQLVVRLL